MAERGYWKKQFQYGAAEACAMEIAGRISTEVAMDEFLWNAKPEGLVKLTGGKYGKGDVGGAINQALKLSEQFIQDLQNFSGPMNKVILDSLEITKTVGYPGGDTILHSRRLNEFLDVALGELVYKSAWWSQYSSAVRKLCSEMSVVRKIHSQ